MRISDWSSDVCSSDLQGGKGASQGQVMFGVVVGVDGQLHHGHVGIGVHDIGGYKGAVVESALTILDDGQPGCLQQLLDAIGTHRSAGRRILNFVGVRRKTLVGVDQERKSVV